MPKNLVAQLFKFNKQEGCEVYLEAQYGNMNQLTDYINNKIVMYVSKKYIKGYSFKLKWGLSQQINIPYSFKLSIGK